MSLTGEVTGRRLRGACRSGTWPRGCLRRSACSRPCSSANAPARDRRSTWRNLLATIAPYGTFATADGSLNICVGNDVQSQRFRTALDMHALAEDPRLSTNSLCRQSREELVTEISSVLARLSSDEVLDRLERAGVPAGPIRSLDEVFADDEVQRRGLQLRAEHAQLGEVSMPGGPWRIEGQPVAARLAPPVLGQHTEEILRELGIETRDEIEPPRPQTRLTSPTQP